jgi:predicted amidohydrolase
MEGQLHLALLQAPLVWEDPVANRVVFANIIKELPGETELIILPEMFTSGFTMNPSSLDDTEGPKTLEWMQLQASSAGAAICGSIVFAEGKKYFNRLFFVYPDGHFRTYDKRHTFTLAGEDKVYTAGKEKCVLEYKGFRICPMICYDLRFPVWSRNTADYDMIIYVANWPAPRLLAWDTLLRARAIENMAYCAGVNRIGTDDLGHVYAGHSAVYDSLGEVVAFSEEEGVLFACVKKEHLKKTRGKLRFLDDRDTFNLVG